MRIHKVSKHLNGSLGANGFCEERIMKSEGTVWIAWPSILLKGAEGGISVEGLDFSCLPACLPRIDWSRRERGDFGI